MHSFLNKIRNIFYKETVKPINVYYNYKRENDKNNDLFSLMKYDPQYQENLILGEHKDSKFNVRYFFEFFYEIIQIIFKHDHNLICINGELIFCTEELTNAIKNEIQKEKIMSRGLFKTLAGLKKNCLISEKYFDKIYKRFGSIAFFALTTQTKLKINVSRKLLVDEYIGLLTQYGSTILVIYALECLDEDFINSKNFVSRFRSMIFSLDYYINDNYQIIKNRLKKILNGSIEFMFK